MTRIRTFFAVCALALPVPAILAGCGGDDGGDSGQDPQTVLDETFTNDQTISSGDLNLSLGVDAGGDQGGSFDATLSGPFQGEADNPQAIPQLDWDASLKGSGAGQSVDFSGGIVVTDDNAYVEYNDKTYEVGTGTFKQVKDQVEAQAGSQAVAPTSFAEGCKQALEQAGATDTSGCDIDLQSWLTDLSDEGTEDVGGTTTVHVHGNLDVNKVLTDVGNLASAFPGVTSSGFDPSQLGAFSGAVTDASMDVYSGEDDHLLRKLDLSLTIDPSAIAGEGAVPIDTIDISFGLELTGVNEQQTITAPSGAQPISQLLGDLGISPSDLGQLPGLPGTSGGGGGGASADDYFQCIQQAGSDPAEINKCASQL